MGNADNTTIDRLIPPAGRALALGAVLLGAVACQTMQDVGEGISSLNPLDHSPDIDKTVFAQLQEAMHAGEISDSGLAKIAPAAGQSFVPTDISDFTVGKAFANQPSLLIPDGDGLDNAYADRMGVIDLPEAEALLNTMLGRIQAAAPVPPVPARVYIEPNLEFMARAEREGAIMLTLGALEQAATDADLVFLLAHEYAHVALDHFQDADSQKAIRTAAGLAGQMLMLRTAVDEDEDAGDLNRALRYPRGISMMTDALFWRGWNQHDELEADLFAADVLAAFGINPLAANGPIGTIAEAENKPLQLPIFEESSLKLGLAALVKGGDSAEKREVTELAVSSAFKLADQTLREITGETHPDVDTRQSLIGDYVERHYVARMEDGEFEAPGDSLLTALAGTTDVRDWTAVSKAINSAMNSTEASQLPEATRVERAVKFMYDATSGPAKYDPFTRVQFANIRAFTGSPDKAVENLELALRTDRSPFTLFVELANRRMDARDFSGAGRAIEQAVARYPAKKNDTLPMRIRLAGNTGDTASAQAHMQSCRNTSLQALIANCEVAWQNHVLKPATS